MYVGRPDDGADLDEYIKTCLEENPDIPYREKIIREALSSNLKPNPTTAIRTELYCVKQAKLMILQAFHESKGISVADLVSHPDMPFRRSIILLALERLEQNGVIETTSYDRGLGDFGRYYIRSNSNEPKVKGSSG